MRISNLGNTAGTFSIQLYNDFGDRVSFILENNLIEAGASSELISVEELYQKAKETDLSFDVGQGNLRARFEASFAPLDVQNIIVSKDGTTFNSIM